MMFENIGNKIIDNKFNVVINYTDEVVWREEDEVYQKDWARVEDYITNNPDLSRLSTIGFYPKHTAIRLSYYYNLKLEQDPNHPGMMSAKIWHDRVFIKPPIDLLKTIYRYTPNDVVDFVKYCYKNYAISELSFMDATWIMAIILGKRD